MFLSRKAKEIPTASASIDVAIDNINRLLKSITPLSMSQVLFRDSLIIFIPIKTSSTKAIQWSIAFRLSAKVSANL